MPPSHQRGGLWSKELEAWLCPLAAVTAELSNPCELQILVI